MRVVRDELGGDRDLPIDGDPLGQDRVALHVAHRHEALDAPDPEPVQHVGHELLETHVLDAGHAFGALEIGLRPISARLALARVVDEKLGHLAERPAFLAVVDDEPHPARLSRGYALLDTVHEVGTAGADIRSEYVGSAAFVVHPGK